jgi:peroxiredoxin
MQEELPKIKELGAQLIAVSPEKPDESLNTQEKHALEFQVLSDADNKVAKQYGIVFKLDKDVADIYEEKFDLSNHNDSHSEELPLPATYVINTNGEIIYAFLDTDYRNRAEPKEVLKALK